jgi:hypothetical protein
MGQTHTVRGRATSVRRDNSGVLSVVYHSTEVVRVNPDGSVVLDSGGWRSFTTKARMNQAATQYGLGYRVYQKAFDWFVSFNGHELTFTDGMTLTR